MSVKPLILFHYPMSPFSEKVRAMLGHADLAWHSVTVKEMPPRPVLRTLTGGYRKIPVAQIGADVFCDTRTIAAEIARRAKRPELALEHCSAAVQAYVARVDREILLACTMCANTPAMGRKVLRSMSLGDIARFAWDRAKIGGTAKLGSAALRNPRQVVRAHLADVEARLARYDFLFGAAPNHADFSTWHGLWFLHDLGQSALLDGHPRVAAWMGRMRAFGHGRRRELDAEQALAQAREAQPRRLAATERRFEGVGQAVTIEPTDYARERSSGRLAGVTATQWILAREEAEVGLLHVHFPQDGYALRPQA